MPARIGRQRPARSRRQTPSSPPAHWLSPSNPGSGFLSTRQLLRIAVTLRLSARQKVVARLLLYGLSRKEMAGSMRMSWRRFAQLKKPRST